MEVPVGSNSKNAMVAVGDSEYQEHIVYLWRRLPRSGRHYKGTIDETVIDGIPGRPEG